jgi:hypothetical protein
MARQEIVDIIKRSVEQGVGREQLVSDLIFAGFNYQEIQGAINEMASKGQLPESFSSGFSRRTQRVYQGQKVNKISELAQESQIEESATKEIVKKYKKRFIVFILTLLAVFVAFAGGLYFYGTLPSVVFSRALNNLSETKSFSYYFQTNVSVDKNYQDPVVNNLFSGQDTIKSQGLVDFSGNYPIISSEISAKIGFDADINAIPFWDFSFISLNPSEWFSKLNLIATTTPQDSQLAQQLSLGWVKMDVSAENISDLIPQKILSQITTYRGLIMSQLTQLFRTISDSSAISGIISLGTEQIDGNNYYHYKINFNKDKIQQIVSQFYDVIGQSDKPLLAAFQNPIDIWVLKGNSVIYRIKYSFSPEISGHTFNPKDFDLYLSEFNQNYQILAPAQYNLLSHVLDIVNNTTTQ